jgi:hypothetical protein
MIFPQKVKRVVLVHQTFTAASDTAAGTVDTKGFSYCMIDVHLGAASAASQNPSVLKVSEGDTTSSWTDIDALTGDSTAGYTVPNSVTALTDGAQTVGFGIDLRKRKRYLKLSVTGGVQPVCAVADLSRADEAPNTDAESGLTEGVNV